MLTDSRVQDLIHNAPIFCRYADTILKKYSSTLATVFTALMSAFLFGQHLTINFLLAIITVFCSMHIFFSQGTEDLFPPFLIICSLRSCRLTRPSKNFEIFLQQNRLSEVRFCYLLKHLRRFGSCSYLNQQSYM